MKTTYFFLLMVFHLVSFAQINETNIPVISSNNGSSPTPNYPPNYTGDILVNYTRTIVPTQPIQTNNQLFDLRFMNRAYEHTTYFDGYLRPLQEVTKKSVNVVGKDIIYHYNYDVYGNVSKDILPFVKTDVSKNAEGKFDKFINSDLLTTYNTLGYSNESYFYNTIVYEESALARVKAQYGAGLAWKNAGKVVQERIANAADALLRFDIATTPSSIPVVNASGYNPGNILVTSVTDEDGNVNLVFKNEFGNIIAEQKGTNRSYNVYDIFGRLRCSISPKAVVAIVANGNVVTNQIVDNLCFKYEYDSKGNTTLLKKPGIGPQFFRYNNEDKLVLSQDAKQRQHGQWLFTKYDVNGRMIQQGIYTTSDVGSVGETMIGDISYGASTTVSQQYLFFSYLYDAKVYTFNDYKYNFSGVEFYIDYYYDNYDYIKELVANKGYSQSNLSYDVTIGNATEGYIKEQGQNALGQLTGLYVRTNDNNKWLARVNYFNKRGELIQTISENLNNTYAVTAFGYDFNSNMVKTVFLANNITIQKKYIYDLAGRVRFIKHKIGASADYRQIAGYEYDAIGRLKTKLLGAMGYAVKYEYNIRNWITGINKQYTSSPNNSQFFGMEISYNSGYEHTYLNGRIAGIKWRTKGSSDELRTYGYLYDENQQLAKADFYYDSEIQTPGVLQWTKDEKDFTTDRMQYDENGNILAMRHMGLDDTRNKITLDDMSYSYEALSNKLLSVSESDEAQSSDPMLHNGLNDFRDVTGSTDYMYDANGNIVLDNNRGMQVDVSSWFTINKPIECSVIASAGNKIKYFYDATGAQLRKIVTSQPTSTSPTTTITTDYIGDMVLENNTLKLINHDEGRIRVTSSPTGVKIYNYDYYLKDHLQNIRCVLAESPEEGGGVGEGAIDPTILDPTVTLDPSSTIDAQPMGYIATSEFTNASWEEELFERVGETRSIRPGSTANPDDYYSAELSAVGGVTLGPGKLIRVMAGDKIQLGAEAFFHSSANPENPLPIANIVTQLVSAITSAASVSGDVSQAFTQATLNGNQISLALNSIQQQGSDTTLPAAYLNYLVFNEAFKVLPDESGMLQVEQANAWQNMDVPQFEIHQNGYLYVFTSNQSQSLVNTDNLYIYHWQSRLLEEFNYYPYGLTFDVTVAPNTEEGNIKYNSQSLEQKEFTDAADQKYGTNWYDFMARSYDMQIGRWMQPDPAMQHFSPYLAMGNNPASFTDPLGLADGDEVVGTRWLKQVTVTAKGPWWFGYFSSEAHGKAGVQDAVWEDQFFNQEQAPIGSYKKRMSINYSQSVMEQYRNIDNYNADKAGFEKVSESKRYVYTNKASSVLNSQFQLFEASGGSVIKNELKGGYRYASTQLNSLKTMRTICNVAKYGGAATSVLSSALSVVKINETKTITASDALNFVSTGVAITALFVTGPAWVPALAATGAILGTVQLISGGVLDDIEYKFE